MFNIYIILLVIICFSFIVGLFVSYIEKENNIDEDKDYTNTNTIKVEDSNLSSDDESEYYTTPIIVSCSIIDDEVI